MHYISFREAVRNSNIPDLRRLLADREAIDAVHSDRANIIAIAAEWGNREVVELLLDHGFPINEDSFLGEPLLNACRGKVSEEETLALVELLLSRGANPNVQGQTPYTHGKAPLHFIARMGYTTVAARLLEVGANPLTCSFNHGVQPLHEAAWKGSSSDPLWKSSVLIAEMLIERGADVNAIAFGTGRTPLQCAASSLYGDMVHLLLCHGADHSILELNGNTPLHSVIEGYMRDPSEDKAQEAVNILTYLLDAGANINATNQEGETALFISLGYRGNPEISNLLLARGADKDILTVRGVSPLARAVDWANETAIEQLLAVGADPAAGEDGRSAVETVVFRNDEATLRKLLPCISSNALIAKSEAIINAAAHQDSVDCLRLLLPYGLQPGGPFPAKKLTPLHKAAQYGAIGTLKLCLEAEADSNARDRLGRTPLYIAARYNRPEAIELLLRFHADPSIADNAGKTPLAIAQEMNKKRAIKILSKGQG